LSSQNVFEFWLNMTADNMEEYGTMLKVNSDAYVYLFYDIGTVYQLVRKSEYRVLSYLYDEMFVECCILKCLEISNNV
jgi:hypothetical protein